MYSPRALFVEDQEEEQKGEPPVDYRGVSFLDVPQTQGK